MNRKYFIMSDLHGEFDKFEEALTHWNSSTETLTLLGDYVDRGPDSMKIVQKLMSLKKDHGDNVIILRGNHDENLTAWLLDTDPSELGHSYTDMFAETLKSGFDFYNKEDSGSGKRKFKKSSRQQRAEHMRYKFRKELQFLAQLELYHETDNMIFVHAGFNLRLDDWKTDKLAMTNIRDPFFSSSKDAPKRTFFGHTPTQLMAGYENYKREKDDNSPWFSPNGDKIGIDGGASMGGQLNALRIDPSGDITEMLAFK